MKLTDIAGSFEGNIWKREVNVRDFIQYNYTPYEGDDSFLAPATDNTLALWDKLSEMFKVEREKGLYDVETRLPQSVTTYGAGYIDKDKEVVVGLQTDAPLKRGIFPKGGVRMVENALNAYGYELDPWTKEIFTKYRKTHNEGVFSAYTSDIRRCRNSHVITGLPDAYGRGRIIGDYRRVALYGVDNLIADKQAYLNRLEIQEMNDKTIQLREETTEQINALKDLIKLGEAYGFDLSRPAENAREAVQYVYLAYLAAIKDQDGAAMSIGRVSTFLDIYIERDIKAGKLSEVEAQELIDQFVMKLRIVRFLRTPEYNALFSGDPVWVTESIGGMGMDGRTMVTKTSFRILHTLLVSLKTGRSTALRCLSLPLLSSMRTMTSCVLTTVMTTVSHAAYLLCASVSKCSSSVLAPTSLSVFSMPSTVVSMNSTASKFLPSSLLSPANTSISMR